MFLGRIYFREFRGVCIVMLLLILNVRFLQAQDVVQHVRGVVIDQLTKSPVEGVEVKLSNKENLKEALTDVSGSFDLQVPVGRYKIICFREGYKTHEQEVLVI